MGGLDEYLMDFSTCRKIHKRTKKPEFLYLTNAPY